MNRGHLIIGAIMAALFPQIALAEADAAFCNALQRTMNKIDSIYIALPEDGVLGRMEIVRAGGSAAVPAAFAADSGWSDAAVGALAAIRDAKAPRDDGTLLSAEDATIKLLENALIAIETAREECPQTEFPDLTVYSIILE